MKRDMSLFISKRYDELGNFLDNRDMLEFLTKFFLCFSHEVIIIPLVILGYVWGNRKFFSQGICLLFISILVNFSLKVTFQVPLLPTVGKIGFAFPSGHMQSSVVLYVWLITKTKNIFYQALIVGLLISIGFSLVYKGYHDYADVLAGVFFGVILIRGFMYLAKHDDKIIAWTLCSISTLLMFYIAKIYTIESHVWMAYYALIGLVLSEQYFVKHQKDESFYGKLLATFFCFISLIGVKLLFEASVFSTLPMFLKQLEWALIGFCLPCARWVSGRITY